MLIMPSWIRPGCPAPMPGRFRRHSAQPSAAMAGTFPAFHHGDLCQRRGRGGAEYRGKDVVIIAPEFLFYLLRF